MHRKESSTNIDLAFYSFYFIYFRVHFIFIVVGFLLLLYVIFHVHILTAMPHIFQRNWSSDLLPYFFYIYIPIHIYFFFNLCSVVALVVGWYYVEMHKTNLICIIHTYAFIYGAFFHVHESIYTYRNLYTWLHFYPSLTHRTSSGPICLIT